MSASSGGRETDGVPPRPPLARWWASAGVALLVAVVVSVAGHAAGLGYPAIAAVAGAVTAAAVGGLYVLVRGRRDPRADLRELAEGRLEPTAPSAVAVIGVGLFVFDQFAAAVIAPLQSATGDMTTLSLLSSYALPCIAAFALSAWAGRFSDRPFLAVLAGSGIAVFLDTVVLVVGLGIPLASFGQIVPVVVAYWTVRGAILLLGGMTGSVVTLRGRAAFVARREARLTAALRGRGDVGGRP